METVKTNFTGKRCFRLLKPVKTFSVRFIFFLVSFNNLLFAKTLSASEIKNLSVKADSEIFFTYSECAYTLFVPSVSSSEITAELPSLPLGARLVSSKKENAVESDGSAESTGTVIKFWFTFTDSGIARLPPLTVRIRGKTYYLPFEEVRIYENPNLISPVLSVEFEDKSLLKENAVCTAGTEIKYRVFIQYAVQVLNYSFVLPKDSIFQETKRYETAALSKEFSPEKVVLAEYSWKPLKEGVYKLPSVFAEAVSYSGSRKTLSLPEVFIRVTKPENYEKPLSAPENKAGTAYKNAFIIPKASSPGEKAASFSPSVQDCEKLALLRSKEKHSPLWSKAREERQEFEKSIGITAAENEEKYPFAFFSRAKYGIFAGGNVSQIPEEKAPAHKVRGGRRVKIFEKAAGWLFIENKDFSGWVKSETVFLIQ